MAKKGFQYSRLLDVKALILNLKSLALRDSEDKQRHHDEKLKRIHAQKQAHLKADDPSSDDNEQALSSRDLQVRTWYTEQLNEDLRQQVQEVQMADQEVQQRRKVVEISAKEKQSLEKLKEHQDQAVHKETEKKEQKQLDEIAGRRRSKIGKSRQP
ncbi:MAG: flagellar FliJ family protein [Fidelibacterota bacterium]|nr:MAG: flagellar FliJ family protein [Candidatus Neomarinimicrobiota bacterium]